MAETPDGRADAIPGGCPDADGDATDLREPALGKTLRIEREQIDELTGDGAFAVACRETGACPEPVDGATFETFAAAERARDAARRYRAVLRSLDPSLPSYDLGVCVADGTGGDLTQVRRRTGRRRENGVPASRQTVTLTGAGGDEWIRVENGPVVHLAGPDALLDGELVTRQLESALDGR